LDEATKLKLRTAELEAALATSNRALDDARLEILQQQQEMDSLRQFDLELTRSENADFVLNLVLVWAKERIQADYGVIARWDENLQAFEVMKTIGIPLQIEYRPGDLMDLPPAIRPGPSAEGVQPSSVLDAAGTRMITDLRHADGRLIAVLDLRRHSAFQFAEADQKFVRSLADRLAISMHTTMLLTKVEELHRNRRQLFRMLSHDLRQPLTVLMGYLQLAEYALGNQDLGQIQSYMGHISNGAKDLNDLLEEVLLMEQIADGTRDQMKPVSLRKLVDQALEKHSPNAHLKEHRLIIDLPGSEATCKGHSTELKEAVGNLIGNAIKYTPAQGRIRISLRQQNHSWRFEVEDTGYGIAPERQSRLFESFYRAQQPGTESIKGTGLGLSLVKSIIQKHGGDVFFKSEPGVGSLFGFWIPGETKELSPVAAS
jgi:signal transduction histidine kinase